MAKKEMTGLQITAKVQSVQLGRENYQLFSPSLFTSRFITISHDNAPDTPSFTGNISEYFSFVRFQLQTIGPLLPPLSAF
jgi:hypothetical protein